jgi:hypothetical protein
VNRQDVYVLDEAVSFASTRRGIPVKINEFKLAEWLENLLDVALSQLEVERPNVESTSLTSAVERCNRANTHCIGPPGGAVTPGGKFNTLKRGQPWSIIEYPLTHSPT